MIQVGYKDSVRTFVFNNGGKENFPYFTVGKNSYINSMKIELNEGNERINIHIGNYCSIAYNVKLLIDRNHDYKSISTSPLLEEKRKLYRKGQIIIGHDVWIGNDVTILSGVNIGMGAVIGAGTVVNKDIPPYAIVTGNPMQIVKYRFEDEQIKKLQKIRWWNWSEGKIQQNKNWFGEEIENFTDKFEKDVNVGVQNLMIEKKEKSILFIPDFNETYSIWEKVIKEYINTFSSNDEVTLVLRIVQNEDFEKNLKKVQGLIEERGNLADILIINDILLEEKQLFKDQDYFITSRSLKTVEYFEWATEFEVGIVSGVDFPIFTDELKRIIKNK